MVTLAATFIFSVCLVIVKTTAIVDDRHIPYLFWCMTDEQSDQIWRNFTILAKFYIFWQSLEGLFSIWQNCTQILAIIIAKCQTFIVLNGQKLEKQSSHLVTLQMRQK